MWENPAERQRIIKQIESSFLPIEEPVSCLEAAEECLKRWKDKAGTPNPAGSAANLLDYIYRRCLAVYYPDNFSCETTQELDEAADFCLELLDTLFDRERRSLPYDGTRDFSHLTDEERAKCEIRDEYERFRKTYDELHIYAFFRIAKEITPFNTLGHIAGVHHIAMYIARQVVRTEVPCDLGLVSATAILHDIGKFGCRKEENGRVPYLHYYYTDIFSRRYHFPVIGHIAANHSTWDLELESLSFENMLLIYADFRAKSVRENGKEIVRFYTLQEAYDVILGKLDNVDEKKADRYRRVFAKLKDLEDYLMHLGVSTDLVSEFRPTTPDNCYALFSQNQLMRQLKFETIRHSLAVLHEMNYEARFTDALETIRSEKEWRNERAYLNILGENASYMTRKQKDAILDYLYEMLMNREGDIRRQAARIMGQVIAGYETVYSKQIPEGAKVPDLGRSRLEAWTIQLSRMLLPDHRITPQQRRWIGYAMKVVYGSIMKALPDSAKHAFLEVLIGYYREELEAKQANPDENRRFVLMDCAADIDSRICTEEEQETLTRFARMLAASGSEELKAAALRFYFLWLSGGWMPEDAEKAELLAEVCARVPGEQLGSGYLKAGIESMLAQKENEFWKEAEGADLSSLYQENQRIDTFWILKLINLDVLRECCLSGRGNLFQFASHLSNMLQTSDRVVVRERTGEELTRIVPLLSDIERYEIAVELVKGLEIGGYSSSKYIPQYLGRIYFYLSDEAQDELLSRYYDMISSNNEKTAVLSLEAIGVSMQELFEHIRQHPDRREWLENKKEQLMGLLCRGLAHYVTAISQEALYIIGSRVFGAPGLTLDEKEDCFERLGKKIMTLFTPAYDRLSLYNNAAALEYFYRFFSNYLFLHGSFPEKENAQVAFFPGTFDPFSQGHKEIVRQIRKLGYEVYLALDEFSWSKKTQPFEIRRRILEMSVADVSETYLFPVQWPINIANPVNLKKLAEVFEGREVWLVMGSDVVEHASAYQMPFGEHTVHAFSHLIFFRDEGNGMDAQAVKRIESQIEGKVRWLKLPDDYQNISSTRIRNGIDRNLDISSMVDSNVESYLYDWNLYSREPDQKRLLKSRPVRFEERAWPEDDLVKELRTGIIRELLYDLPIQKDGRILCMRDERRQEQITGAVIYHETRLSDLYEECSNSSVVDWLRRNTSGRLVVITGIYGDKDRNGRDNRQTVLTELLAGFLEQEVTYVLCFGAGRNARLLMRQGFAPIPGIGDSYVVDMRMPIVMLGSQEMGLKEPFDENPIVQKALRQCPRRLQAAFTRLYPGNLVLTLESDVLQHGLIKKITEANDVPPVPVDGYRGPRMCVPFGAIMHGVQAPNTVTKTLHTEKLYTPDLKSFKIGESPNYASLPIQIRTIKALNRPVLLVDDLYDKGYRMSEIAPVLRQEQVEVAKVIVGVMSGSGRDLARQRKLDVDGVYFVPNMRAWFAEADLYPFFGGDSVQMNVTGAKPQPFLPSVNPILPFRMSDNLPGVAMSDYYHLSEVCLENAGVIWETLEAEYRRRYGRKLTIGQLGDVLAQPRYPDYAGAGIRGSEQAPSAVIEFCKNWLARMRNMM